MSGSVHAGLASGRWGELTLVEQLANVGSEVGRAARARAQGSDARFEPALARALDLFDLTLSDPRWRYRTREIARAREVVCDFLVGDNEFGSTAESLDRYFLAFARVAGATGSRPRRDRAAGVGSRLRDDDPRSQLGDREPDHGGDGRQG